jgi:hypothetical protein
VKGIGISCIAKATALCQCLPVAKRLPSGSGFGAH